MIIVTVMTNGVSVIIIQSCVFCKIAHDAEVRQLAVGHRLPAPVGSRTSGARVQDRLNRYVFDAAVLQCYLRPLLGKLSDADDGLHL